MEKVQSLKKRADVYNDYVASQMTGLVLPDAVGKLVGLMAHSPNPQKMQKMNDKPGLSYVPGVAGYRQVARRAAQSKMRGGGKGKVWGESFGGLTSAALLASIFAATGAAIGSRSETLKNAMTGMADGLSQVTNPTLQKILMKVKQNPGTAAGAVSGAAGALVGAGTSEVVNSIASMIGMARRTRTQKQQAAYQQSGGATAANWLVPGYAAYQNQRNTKRQLADDVEARQRRGE